MCSEVNVRSADRAKRLGPFFNFTDFDSYGELTAPTQHPEDRLERQEEHGMKTATMLALMFLAVEAAS